MIRCGKCGGLPVRYIEVWHNHVIFFEANGGVPEDEGYLEMGDPHHVEAECSCGHRWRLRKVFQITQVRERS